MDRQLIKYVLEREDFGAEVTVAGWVRTRRDSKGGFSFIELYDGSEHGRSLNPETAASTELA